MSLPYGKYFIKVMPMKLARTQHDVYVLAKRLFILCMIEEMRERRKEGRKDGMDFYVTVNSLAHIVKVFGL